ncbi:hypothetical protein IscW_ISCW018627 [Ixodes scapularis]|uniref:KASH domain-containing protein n=1 Tax=Ixodes scapularis TaxID=6945 RepID=B7PLV8_IXOSC|nr:hypothetical protein IscW_ISCW018627 [Ixodes scapularis]|eukprot:XP_002434756.1 hypothetical protein IscW_ISCW018627 [Ixodes scapularis]
MKVLASSEQCASARRIRRSGAQLSELQMTRSRATDALAPADLQGNKRDDWRSDQGPRQRAGRSGSGRGGEAPSMRLEWQPPPVARAQGALPVQVALLLMYCVACLMEPHCCDLLNNFHASFGPQLRDIATECRWRGCPRHDGFTAISVYEEQIVS